MQKIDKVVALVAEFFVDEEFSREEIAGVVREAYEVADVDFGAEEVARAAPQRCGGGCAHGQTSSSLGS